MSELTEIIRRDIQSRGGVIPFADFMARALYESGLGYYERPVARTGRKGDFYTSVSTGSLFGELLAFRFDLWLAEIWNLPGIKSAGAAPFAGQREAGQIVESGAEDGQLALDILGWFHQFRPETLRRLEYWIVEPSEGRQKRQRQNLSPFSSHTRWFRNWAELPGSGVTGVIFSNELLDAFPVRRWSWEGKGKRWTEWGVGWNGSRFVWQPLPPTQTDSPSRPQINSELEQVLPPGFIYEFSEAAENWWREAASALRSGRLVTIDYGSSDEEFFHPERKAGTLRAYFKHQMSDDLLSRAGEQDLTAHVNFSALQREGERAGLRTISRTSQAQFLARIAQRVCKSPELFGEWTQKRTRQFQTLTHPELLGRSFSVLIQERSAPL